MHRNLLQYIATYQLTATTVPSNVTRSVVVALIWLISFIDIQCPIHRLCDTDYVIY